MTTELSLRDFLDCFLCVLLLQRGVGEGRKGVGDWVKPKGRSGEGVQLGSLRPFYYAIIFKGKITRAAVNQPPFCQF